MSGSEIRSQGAGPARTMFAERAAQWAALERGWKALQPANPFLSWSWNQAWIETQAVRPLVLADRAADGRLLGLLALQRLRRRGLVWLEGLGEGGGGDDFDCVMDCSTEDIERATGWLERLRQRRDWQLLRLTNVRSGGCLARAAAACGAAAEAGDWLPYLPLPATFEAFLDGQSPNFRAEIRRRRRVLSRTEATLRLECAESPEAILQAFEHLMRLHNLRRAEQHGKGIFEAPGLRAFHRRAAYRLALVGQARVYTLRTDTAVIAALYGLESGGRFYYFQSGFDPAWTGLSPGTVLLSAVVEDAIRRGLKQIEFLRGEESYKARWTRQRRPTVQLWMTRGAAGAAYLRLRSWRRQMRTSDWRGTETAEAA